MLLLVEIRRVSSWISVRSWGAGARILVTASGGGGGDGKLKRLEVVCCMFYGGCYDDASRPEGSKPQGVSSKSEGEAKSRWKVGRR